MKVLMFGWEFPPHISGGLGTACFGLTKSLLDEHVHVLFVVPKAQGDEEIELIDASRCEIPRETKVKSSSVRSSTMIQEASQVITVPSSLTPYSMNTPSDIIERWNWELHSHITQEVETPKGIRYEFSGRYGPALFDEVQRYAEVAAHIAKQNSFDVIHAHDWLTYLAGISAKKVSSKPLIIHVHATEFDRAAENSVDQRVIEIEKKGMTEADMIIAVSQWTKDIIVNKYGVDGDKVHVVHNGVIPSNKAEIFSIPKIDTHVITFLGRITHQKGPQYFVEAARKVLDHYPDVHFIMAGAGDLMPAMIDRVAELKLSSRIHFTGFLKGMQVHQLWSVTDAYVMPSVSEPFGITPLEAVQAGVPVILSNQSGAAEVMNHVIKVDFWDTDGLASAMISLIKYKSLQESLTINSKKEIESVTWKHAAKQINELYHEL